MKVIKIFWVSTCVITLSGTLYAQGGEVNYSVDYASKYIWSGYDLTPNNRAAIQPGITYSHESFEVGYWSSFAVSDRDNLSSVDEFDVYFSYSSKFGDRFEYSVGFTHYSWLNMDEFNFSDGTTQEPYFSLTLAESPFSPTVTAYYDLNLGDGLYLSAGSGYSLEVGTKSWELSVVLGYTDGQWGADKGVSDLVLSAGTSFDLSVGSISPTFNVAFVPNDSVNDENEFWISVSFAN